MDFIKNCKTTALAINGYATVKYTAYYVQRSVHDDADEAEKLPVTDYLHGVESDLRNQGYLAISYCPQRIMFVFDREDKTDEGPAPAQETPQLDGYHCRVVCVGELRAADLGKSATQTSHASHASSTNPPSSQAAKSGLAGISQSAQVANTFLTAIFDPTSYAGAQMIYKLFISAITAKISFQLVRYHGMVPLNSRTLASTAEDRSSEALDSSVKPQTEPVCWLLDLDVHLTTGGTVVVSCDAVTRPRLSPLSRPTSRAIIERSPRKVIRIGPSGALARFISFGGDVSGSLPTPSSHYDGNKRDPGGFAWSERGLHVWKCAVEGWLQKKGLFLPLDAEQAWVRIRLSSKKVDSEADEGGLGWAGSSECVWPAALCFFENTKPLPTRPRVPPSTAQGAPGHRPRELQLPDNGSGWFNTADSTGFQDPLRFAQEWFQGKLDRDKAIESRGPINRGDDDPARAAQDITSDVPSSPFTSRTGTYGDLQAISGVYPTPPDAVITQASSVPYTGDPGQPPPSSSDSREPQSSRGGDQADPDRMDVTYTAPDTSTTNPQPDAIYQGSPDDVDDLFGPMDDEEYGGNDVTDADFNFFDSPGVQGSNEAPPEIQSNAAEDNQKDPDPISMSEEETKATSAATHDGVAVAPDADTTMMGGADGVKENDVRIPQSSPNEIPTQQPDHMDDPGALKIDVDAAQKPDTAVPSPPLSPVLVKEKLFPTEPSYQTGPTRPISTMTRKGSAFEPVKFNNNLQRSDAKYRGSGRFNFLANDSRLKPPTSSTTQSPTATRTHRQPLVKLPSRDRINRDQGAGSTPASDTAGHTMFHYDGSSDSEDDSSSEAESDEETYAHSPAQHMLYGRSMSPLKRKHDFADGGEMSQGTTPRDFRRVGEEASVSDEQAFMDMPKLLQSFDSASADWSLVRFPPPTENVTRPVPEAAVQQTSTPGPESGPPSPAVPKTPGQETPVRSPMNAPERKKQLPSREFIGIVQILADQVIYSTLDLLLENTKTFSAAQLDIAPPTDQDPGPSPVTKLGDAVKEVFPTATETDLVQFASIQDAPPDISPANKTQPRPMPRRGPDSFSGQVYPITPPHLRVRRGEVMWDLLSPALSFWETLGLIPNAGPKNVLSFCMFPFSADLKSIVGGFMDNLSGTYESCRLGTHHRGSKVAADFEGGLVPLMLPGSLSQQAVWQTLQETGAKLGRALALIDPFRRDQTRQNPASTEAEENQRIDNFVIYMVNPFETLGPLKLLCATFWALFITYRQALQAQHLPAGSHRPDVILQLIPMKYVASFDSPPVLEPASVIKLAREVYDRCRSPVAPNDDHSPLGIYAAPSVQLEETLPRTVQFRNTVDAPSDLLRENSYLHIGYAVSVNADWITAAWTDSAGRYQATVSYSSGGRTFAEVAREIWQTSMDIMQARRVTWRVCIARAGIMDKEELEGWTSCTSTSNLPNPSIIALISVDLHPALALIPHTPPVTIPPAAPASAGPNISTPGTTPTPHPGAGVSPSASAETAGDAPQQPDPLAPDIDATLVDLPDETCGVILGHRLNMSYSLDQYRPALASGLLVKRGLDATIVASNSGWGTDDSGRCDEKGPLCVAVSLVWVGAAAASSAANNRTGGAGSMQSSGMHLGGDSGNATPSTPGTTGPSVGGNFVASRARDEALLRELLSQYRGLGLLARVRGLRECKGGTVPWHLAAAERGAKGVERVMTL